MKLRWAYILLISLFVLPAGSAAPDEQVTVTAHIELSGKGELLSGDSSDAVLWLTRLDPAPPGQPAPARKRQLLIQSHKTFLPHLLVVQVGSAVEFPNRDPFFHNVFSLFEGKRFDLGLYEGGSTRSVLFNRSGVSYIFCNIHPEMSAVVVALKTPYYGISDHKGNITIASVPAGRYEVQVWHERAVAETLSALTHTVVISEAANSVGVFRLEEERSLLKTHKNKYGKDYDSPATPSPAYPRP